MLQCFSNGLEHIKLKMNSRSSRHHVERWISLHFPFSECSIITTAVTFIAGVCVCLCAYTAFVPYVWIYPHACVHLCGCLLLYSCVQRPCVAGHVLRQRITSAWLLLEGEPRTSICFSAGRTKQEDVGMMFHADDYHKYDIFYIPQQVQSVCIWVYACVCLCVISVCSHMHIYACVCMFACVCQTVAHWYAECLRFPCGAGWDRKHLSPLQRSSMLPT